MATMRKRFTKAIVMALFASPFLALAVYGGTVIARELGGAFLTRDWKPADAKVIEFGTQSSEFWGRRKNKLLVVHYEYVVEGQSHLGTKIRLADSNFVSLGRSVYQDEWFERFNSAKSADRPITAFFNPENPTQAVLSHDIRWGKVGVAFGLLMIFGPIGLLFVNAVVYALTVRLEPAE
jgi:hypothetical protein